MNSPSSQEDTPPSASKRVPTSYPVFFQQMQTVAPPTLLSPDRPLQGTGSFGMKQGPRMSPPPKLSQSLGGKSSMSAAESSLPFAPGSFAGSAVSVASGPPPYRSFPEVALTEIGTFLQNVNKELEQIHLRHSLEKGEYFTLFAGENIGEGSIAMRASDTVSPGKSTSTASYSPSPTRRGRGGGGGGGDHDDAAGDTGDTDMVALMKQTVFPFAEANDMFQYPSEAWFRPLDFGGGLPLDETPLVTASEPVAVAVTEDPPLFECGMLYDPINELFLFGGAGFTEEARVLSASLPTGVPPVKGKKDFRSRFRHTKILVREYQSISKRTPLAPDTSGGGGGGGAEDSMRGGDGSGGFIVQTLSLLGPDAEVEADKRALVLPDRVRQLLPLTLAGTLTRVFIVPRPNTDSVSISGMAAMPRAEGNLRLAANNINGAFLHLQRSSWTNWADRPTSLQDMGLLSASIDAYIMENAAFLREPIGDEAELRYTNPKLYVWALQHDPASLLEPTDTIRMVLEYYARNQVLYSGMRRLIKAVKTLQRFFRMCLARKDRAKQHMLQLWRHLELESRFKLQHYQPPPSSIERVDMIANNVLQQHMVTSREYKLQLLEELWQQRHADYVKWRRQKAQEAQFKRQMQRSYRSGVDEDEIFTSNAVEQILQRAQEMEDRPRRTHDAATVLHCTSDATPPRKTVGFRQSVTELKCEYDEDEMDVDEEEAYVDNVSWLDPGSREKNKNDEARVVNDEDDNDAPPPMPTFSMKRWGKSADVQLRSVTARGEREETYMHEHFGWYIAPEKLLYESHRRLLASLKDSVLTLEHEQYEGTRGDKEKEKEKTEVPFSSIPLAANSFASPSMFPPYGDDSAHPMNFTLPQPLPAIGPTTGGLNGRSTSKGGRASTRSNGSTLK